MDTCIPITFDYKINGEPFNRSEEILTPGAIDFVLSIQEEFGERRKKILKSMY